MPIQIVLSSVFVCASVAVITFIQMLCLYVTVSVVFPAERFMADCAGIEGLPTIIII